MFFKQVYRNAAKNRKGNGLFFGSLIIAIVAFYTLLSLGEQDVMRFLATIESDAVRKLLLLLPAVYVMSLFFVFFLVYFACKYQTDSRRKEFGVYLMLGMRRGRMFAMLFCETVWSSLLSVAIGLPTALLVTETISLATAKAVGLGILEHHFSFSPNAILWTVCGFLFVQMLSLLIICLPLAQTEPAEFLREDASKEQSQITGVQSSAFFLLGAMLLLIAYLLGIFRLKYLDLSVILLLVCGILGTFFLYRGLGGFLGKRIRKKAPAAKGLSTFTARQIQENVIHQHKALAVSSLLMLIALSCISYGISLGLTRAGDSRSTDFSLFVNQDQETAVRATLAQETVKEMTKAEYPVYLSHLRAELWDTVNSDSFGKALQTIDGGEHIRQNMRWSHIIAQSGYNQLLKAMGKEPLALGEHQAALFSSLGRDQGNFYSILDKASRQNTYLQIDGERFDIIPGLRYDNIVADRGITLYTALILPDSVFFRLAAETEPYCYNLHLKDELVEEMGLMNAIRKMDGYLSQSGLEYDSYLGGIGRNLFYTVSASYLTIYLGILFLLISGTVIGLKFLMNHRKNKHRYQTLLMLGADIEDLCTSVKQQISGFFFQVLALAVLNSIVAIVSMFNGLTKLPMGVSPVKVAVLAGGALTVFVIIEIVYITVVKKTACREIRGLESA